MFASRRRSRWTHPWESHFRCAGYLTAWWEQGFGGGNLVVLAVDLGCEGTPAESFRSAEPPLTAHGRLPPRLSFWLKLNVKNWRALQCVSNRGNILLLRQKWALLGSLLTGAW